MNAEHIEMIRQWASQGVDLNGIQKNLAEQGCSIRFMDLRFLLLDHGIEIAEAAEAAPAVAAEVVEAEPEESMPAGKSVEVFADDLQIPGTIISGKAIFRSGARGSWQFDLQGNFTWSAMSGKPEENELREFQVELNNMLRKMA